MGRPPRKTEKNTKRAGEYPSSFIYVISDYDMTITLDNMTTALIMESEEGHIHTYIYTYQYTHIKICIREE